MPDRVMDGVWILFIDIPNETTRVNHMHAWGYYQEMEALRDMLTDLLGKRRHLIINGYVCPHCGATQPELRRR